MFFHFDPLYFLLVGPAMLLSLLASWRVRSTFSRWDRVISTSGFTGAGMAQRILDRAGITGVTIEPVDGFLSDHYDPGSHTLRLSPAVYSGRSVSALGVAAHEVGHAIQHARDYAPLKFRSALVPAASIGSGLSYIVFTIGLFLGGIRTPAGDALVWAGIILFSGAVLFSLVTLPVEFDASRRALATIETSGDLHGEDLGGARSVLRAAALTYVAAAITSLMTLLYFLLRSGILGGRSNDR